MSRFPTVRPGLLNEGDFSEDIKFNVVCPEDCSPELYDHSSSTKETSTPVNDQGVNAATFQSSTPRQLTPSAPRLPRALSMPLPSQIGHLNHPSRSPGMSPPSISGGLTSSSISFQDLSLELADALQLAIQTLLRLSPPQLFDPAKEQYSPCAVGVPTTSISALLTSMKYLNYISANIHRFGSSPHDESASPIASSDVLPKDEFDIGELLQSVGDSLGGVAAEAEVDLVLHHGDASIKHIGVKGDECGISYALTHIIHQVLTTSKRGDSIEIGLTVTGKSSTTTPNTLPSLSTRRASISSSSSDSPILDDDGPVVCTFDVAHRFSSSVDPVGEPPPTDTGQLADVTSRHEPRFDTLIFRRLLRHIGGVLNSSLQPRLFRTGRRCELVVTLERGLALSGNHSEVETDFLPDLRIAREPTLEELTAFAETLRGKKVAFHASSQGSFAHHLTRYLTAWGMDISHVPTDGAEDKVPTQDAFVPLVYTDSASPSEVGVPPLTDGSDAGMNAEGNKVPSFIIIDDDVITLRRRLLEHRVEANPGMQMHLQPRKNVQPGVQPLQRPSLAANHRPRSSPALRHSPAMQPARVPVLHFTSLANYRVVKDAMQGDLLLASSPFIIPEVIVIPKPAGPRRLLTALHIAVNKPVVDPFFAPIATSPLSPNGPGSQLGRKTATVPTPAPSRSESAASTRAQVLSSPSMASSSVVSSPLPAAGSPLEYFSHTDAMKKLGESAASGLVIQSPDGRPAGIFFQPQSRASSIRSTAPGVAMERERDGLGLALKGAENLTPTPSDAPPTAVLPRSLPPRSELQQLSETELLRSLKGKGHAAASPSPERDKPRSTPLSSTAWREATKTIAQGLPRPVLEVDHTNTPPIPRSPPSPESRKRRPTPVGQKGPAVAAVPGKKKPRSMGSNIVPPISVLIVEDNAINQTILSTFMRRNKIKYDVAWNGREAVEKWRNGNFHLILMDIQMPVMDGIEATKEIRRLEKLENPGAFPSSPGESSHRLPDSRRSSGSTTPFRSQVIIVALTASSLQSDRVAALAAGCNDFLTKPVTNSWLNDKIIEWGSIKALQMWAELRPEVARNINQVQEAQAQTVARKLHSYPVPRRSPLSDTHVPPDPAREGSEDGAVDTVVLGKAERQSSEKDGTSSEINGDQWQISEDEPMQDPITEPPAVIETPEIQTVSLPDVDSGLQSVTGEAALINYLEESKQQFEHPTLPGQRALGSLSSSTSIASAMHSSTPDDGGTITDGCVATCAAARESGSSNVGKKQ